MLKTVGYKEAEKMFDNAGKQIKGIAIGFFITQIVVGILVAVTLFVISALADEDAVWIGCLLGGLFTLVATPFAAWFSALILYGFGEIVDTAIANRLNSDGEANIVSEAKPKSTPNAYFSSYKSTKTAPSKTAATSGPAAWTCTCGKVNPPYMSSCSCGKTAREIREMNKPQ